MRAFKEAEARLASTLGLDPDAAGALVVGRDRAGRPIRRAGRPAGDDRSGVLAVLSRASVSARRRTRGLRDAACPAAAQIRLMNSRDRDAPYPLARRGMTYGSRPAHPDEASGCCSWRT